MADALGTRKVPARAQTSERARERGAHEPGVLHERDDLVARAPAGGPAVRLERPAHGAGVEAGEGAERPGEVEHAQGRGGRLPGPREPSQALTGRRGERRVGPVELGIGSGRVEAVNNEIKVTVRMGYGFRNVDNLVSLLMLRCSDVRPAIPGRAM